MLEKLTIQDIARLAGVSKATVSRVLNKKPDVDPQTRERILRLMEEHGFVPNQAATRLAGGRSKILGMVVPSLSWPFIPEIIRGVLIPTLNWPIIPEIMRGVTDTVRQTPYELLLYSIHHEQDHSEIIQRILATQLISGLLAVLPGQATKDLLKLRERGLPMVMINDQEHSSGMPWVGIDNRQSAYQAVQHLIGLGHKRIGHIRGLYACSQERYQGYLDALLEAGLAPDLSLVQQGDFEVSSGQECATALFALPERPSAIFAGNDQMAYGAMIAAERHGLRIPEDLALIGFDDIPFSAHLRPALSTVHQPFFEMGRQAVELLVTLIESQNSLGGEASPYYPAPAFAQQPMRVLLTTELVIRESCGTGLATCTSTSIDISC